LNLSVTWVLEDYEPVQVHYRVDPEAFVSEADCVCSKTLASHLIHLLWSGDEAKIQLGTPVGNAQDFTPFLPAA
jgi:hypothetical protein